MVSNMLSTRGIILVGLVVVLAALTQIEVDHDIVLLEKAAALPATRPTVFKFLSKMESYAEVNSKKLLVYAKLWFPGLESFEAVDSSPMGIGKHFTEVQYLSLYGELVYDNLITGYESPRYISFISNTWLLPRVEMTLERRENKSPRYPTEFRWKLYSRRRSLLFKYVVGPVIGFAYSSTVRQGLFNLRYHFE